MYRVRTVQISRSSPLFEWTDDMSRKSNNLYNAALFRERQMICSRGKSDDQLSDNEKEIIAEVNNALPRMKKEREIPESGVLGYEFMNDLMKTTENPDYLAEGLARQTAQNVLKDVCEAIKSFFSAMKSYRKDPSAFTGRPEMPGYKRKQGCTAFSMTNQDCVLKWDADRKTWMLKLPKTKKRLRVGKKLPEGRLMEVTVAPKNGEFQYSLVFDDGAEAPASVSETPERMIGIDMGVKNLMAVVNNIGEPSMIMKGGAAKSANQLYNKKIAKIMSSQTKGGTAKFIPDENYYAVTRKRNFRISDIMHKEAKILITWCVEHRIDTIVIGKNPLWKQNASEKDSPKSSMQQKTDNQNFVQIPFAQLIGYIQYLAERRGIRVIEQEESYTSLASFLDGDPIPVCGNENGNPKFSGKRDKRSYTAKDGTVINADLNGAANILRKAFSDAFRKHAPKFDAVLVIRNPGKEPVLHKK